MTSADYVVSLGIFPPPRIVPHTSRQSPYASMAGDSIVIRLIYIRSPLKTLPTPQFTSLETSF